MLVEPRTVTSTIGIGPTLILLDIFDKKSICEIVDRKSLEEISDPKSAVDVEFSRGKVNDRCHLQKDIDVTVAGYKCDAENASCSISRRCIDADYAAEAVEDREKRTRFDEVHVVPEILSRNIRARVSQAVTPAYA